jgi:hypothetical protein
VVTTHPAGAATAAFGTDAGLANALPQAAGMNDVLDAIQALHGGGDEDAAALCRAALQEACLDTFRNVEADTASWARSVLPESAVKTVEGVLSQFQARYSLTLLPLLKTAQFQDLKRRRRRSSSHGGPLT